MTNKETSALDKRAALGFQELAKESAYFSVTCRFRRVVKTEESVKHEFWPKGMKLFQEHFGNPASFFAGVLEYIRLATGWPYPYRGLAVMVFACHHQTSAGYAIYPPGLLNTGAGEIRVNWAEGEFTLTVIHELVHLFKKGAEEDWVEQRALMLTLGI